MRIVFIGKVAFSKVILSKIIDSNIEISGVITSKDKGINSDHSDLISISKRNNIPIIVTNNANSENVIKWVTKIKPDLILCIGWSQILKKKLLQIPKKFTIGYHPTDIPENRGRHPLIWSLALGLDNMFSTFFIISEKVDLGAILNQRKVSINKDDNSKSMYLKLEKIASNQIIDIIKKLRKNKKISKQINGKKGNLWRLRSDVDGKVDWRMSPNAIHNLVRALNEPYDGAYFLYRMKRYTLIKSKVVKFNKNNIEPGKVIMIKNGKPIIKCGSNAIAIIETKPKINLKIGEYL